MKEDPRKGYKLPEYEDEADVGVLNDNTRAIGRDMAALEEGAARLGTLVEGHVANKANPHGVTAAQVGAYTKAEVDEHLTAYGGHLSDKGNPHDVTAGQTGAYTMEETGRLLAEKVDRDEVYEAGRVLLATERQAARTGTVTEGELNSLVGAKGNVQEQLDNAAWYNYLPALPLVSLGSGGDGFPAQGAIDGAVIPLIEAAYPAPAYRDAVLQNVQTQSGAKSKAILWAYYDGTQSDGFVGWRYVTDIDTLLHRANGGVYGVVRDSDDITWRDGEGTVGHAATAATAGEAYRWAEARSILADLERTDAGSLDGTADVTVGITGTLPIAHGGTGNTAGAVASAAKLETARQIQTDLGSPAAASFDGTEDVAPGVTGTLPVRNGGTGNIDGLAASAKKLETAHTIRTDLGSTATASFDGTEDVTPGVAGTLPIAHGGTGNTVGLAASATKLATARSFSISGGATAAAKSFDGSGAVELAVTGLDVGKANAGTLPVARGGTGNTTGNAASATKLATGRTIQTDLAGTGAATFDGSANVTPGVTGILPVARGGTGNTAGKAADSAKLNGQEAGYYATAATVAAKADTADVLTKTGTTSYTPTGSYHPATKAYVDSKVAGIEKGDMLKSVYDTNDDGKVDKAAQADTATKLAAARSFSISGGATAAAKGFDGSGAVELAVTGLDVGKANAGTLPVARGGTGNTTGNAASATKLATGRNFSISGGATAAAKSFDGSGAVELAVTGLDMSKANAGTLPVARGGTGNTTGNAASATKLATGRAIQTDLASTAAATFDGSANVAPGVTGILPVARGGTGNATGNAASATKLATARNFSISGGATAAAKGFDGSGAVELAVTGLDMGKANAGILPVARGGTGVATLASGQVLVGNAAGAVTTRAIATAPASGSSALLTAGGAYTALANKANKEPAAVLSLPHSYAAGAIQYFRTQEGLVCLTLGLNNTRAWARYDLVATMPAGYRPTTSLEFSGMSYGGSVPAIFKVGPDGKITLNTAVDANAKYVYLHCCFRAAV